MKDMKHVDNDFQSKVGDQPASKNNNHSEFQKSKLSHPILQEPLSPN